MEVKAMNAELRSTFSDRELELVWLELLDKVPSREILSLFRPIKVVVAFFKERGRSLPRGEPRRLVSTLVKKGWLSWNDATESRVDFHLDAAPAHLREAIETLLALKDRLKGLGEEEALEPHPAPRTPSSLTPREWVELYDDALRAMLRQSFCVALDGYLRPRRARSILRRTLSQRNIRTSDDLVEWVFRRLTHLGFCEEVVMDDETFVALYPPTFQPPPPEEKEGATSKETEALEETSNEELGSKKSRRKEAQRHYTPSLLGPLENAPTRPLPSWHPFCEWESEFQPRTAGPYFPQSPLSARSEPPIVSPPPLQELYPEASAKLVRLEERLRSLTQQEHAARTEAEAFTHRANELLREADSLARQQMRLASGTEPRLVGKT